MKTFTSKRRKTMLKNIVRTIKDATIDWYDMKLVVLVNRKYFLKFMEIALHYGRTQICTESSRSIVVIAMKNKNYLKFMKELHVNGLNLSEALSIHSTNTGLIDEVIEWKGKP
jgi:hypothetical protein